MRDIELVYSHSTYRCTCPLPVDDEDEIRLALACWEREQAHAARQPDEPAVTVPGPRVIE